MSVSIDSGKSVLKGEDIPEDTGCVKYNIAFMKAMSSSRIYG
jgi:hypothetical protein